MKRFLKPFLFLCIALMCIISVPSVTHAANYTPGQVKKLKATAAESKITLKWNAVSKASGYNIYLLDASANTWKKVASTKKRTYTFSKLTNNATYRYAVAAYRTVKGKVYEGKKSATVNAVPTVKKPGKVSLSVKSCGNGQVSLKWKKISNATGYEIFQYSNSTKKFESIGTVSSGTSVTVKNLTNGTSYQFKARAYRTVGGVTRYADFSSTITVKPISVTGNVKDMPTMTYKATVKKTVNAPYYDGSGKVTVNKGTSVTVLVRNKAVPCKVQLPNGKIAKIEFDNLVFKKSIYNNKYNLSNSTVQDFVNYKGYHSNTQYLIWISTYKQHMYIFKGSQCNWKWYKTFKCSTGKAATPSIKGVFRKWKISRKFYFPEPDGRILSYADYATYFNGGNAIHSWLKYTETGGHVGDGSLGNPSSHGCVRLNDANSYFVYNNIPMGTTVVVY